MQTEVTKNHLVTLFQDRYFADVTQLGVLSNTLGAHRTALGLVQPKSTEEIIELVKLANQQKISLYTYSTGKNWGYGCSLPVEDNCLLVDLSLMNKILEFSEEQAYVVVEPGVTQRDLYEFFLKNNVDFMVPTTGAGPNCSILGNALEKGYGITPYEDHFSALLQLQAVMSDGSIYRSSLNQFGGTYSDRVFKWKLGPYIDGLFAQGNAGIVTRASFALARRPENITQFYVFLPEEDFEEAIKAIARIKQHLGRQLGGVNLMNKRRVLSMARIAERWTRGAALPEMELREIAKSQKMSDWLITGAIYGPQELVSGTCKRIKKEFSSFSQRTVFLSKFRVKILKRLLKPFPLDDIKEMLGNADRVLDILSGIPSELALPLAYLKHSDKPQKRVNLDPSKDGCGILWFSPLVPTDPPVARDYIQEVSRVCLAFDIDPLITMTTVSERCFDSTVPILFDKNDAQAIKNARACYDRLIEVSQTMGIFPYRMDVDSMRKHFKPVGTKESQLGNFHYLNAQLKKAMDPAGIFSPGRYLGS